MANDQGDVETGQKVLNAAQVNWYWIPPKPHHQKQNEEEPLVLDHVFSYDQGKQAWANVHAFDHGELLTGQLRLLHQPPPQPPPTPPEKHIDLDGVINSVMDEVMSHFLTFSLSTVSCYPSPFLSFSFSFSVDVYAAHFTFTFLIGNICCLRESPVGAATTATSIPCKHQHTFNGPFPATATATLAERPSPSMGWE